MQIISIVCVVRGMHGYTCRFFKAVSEYNETRASDVFVVNFGAHYHETPEQDVKFKEAVFPILDAMAELGNSATVVWRYIVAVLSNDIVFDVQCMHVCVV